jgi:hypothetical protein
MKEKFCTEDLLGLTDETKQIAYPCHLTLTQSRSIHQLRLFLHQRKSFTTTVNPLQCIIQKTQGHFEGYRSLIYLFFGTPAKEITSDTTLQYFSEPLHRDLEAYCKENLNFKILLVTDNCQGHPRALIDLSKNIKVVFLPPNTSPLLQPMDQGVTATFKSTTYTEHLQN